MAQTYEKIATSTPSGVTTVTFSAIPSTYDDLRLIVWVYPSQNMDIRWRINGDTGSTYSQNYIATTSGSISVSAGSGTSNTYTNANLTNNWSLAEIDIFQYKNTSAKKAMCWNFYNNKGSTNGSTEFGQALWNNTNTITSIEVYSSIGSFLSGSRFTLYGIAEV